MRKKKEEEKKEAASGTVQTGLAMCVQCTVPVVLVRACNSINTKKNRGLIKILRGKINNEN